MTERKTRDQIIVGASYRSIGTNVFLAAFKAFIGWTTGSIAVVLDAVNNLSDAMSGVITIVGTKLASKPSDRKHPMGYGRVEYMSATIISVIVLYAGITSLVESVKKIIHPEQASYTTMSLVILAVAVLAKLMLGSYMKKTGEKVNSDSLIASGKDASFDAIISASTIVAAIIFMFTNISLEAWLGAIISAVIIKSGIEMLQETISQIIGERIDSDLTKTIKQEINSIEGVLGTYDLVLHNYGPDRYNGSVHIEVPDTMTIDELDTLERKIVDHVYMTTGVAMTGISIYAGRMDEDRIPKIQKWIKKTVLAHEEVMQIHGLYTKEDEKMIRFDILMSFETPNRDEVYQEIRREILAAYPDWHLYITIDYDISD